jgi:hypothetical protein
MMGENISKYHNVKLVNPKETAVFVALDMGYTEKEIFCCYEPGMNAASLVQSLYEFDKSLTEATIALKQKCVLENKELQNETERQAFVEETTLLYVKTLCVICMKRERCEIALPCGHFEVCSKCCKDTCILCHCPVDEYKRIYMI